MHQHDIDHGGLVDHQEVAIERIVLAPLEPPALGIDFQKPVGIDLASKPVASVIRLAARPVGAHSKSLTSFAARIRRMALTIVVLPTQARRS